jgi:hypothetical protein
MIDLDLVSTLSVLLCFFFFSFSFVVDFFLAFGAVVAHGAHGGFEVSGGLLLDLVRQVVDLEPVQSGRKNVSEKISFTRKHLMD